MNVAQEESGRYEIVDTIADGAMGTVCLARDRLLDRIVAMKTVNLSGVGDAQERQHLRAAILREAQLTQILAHPNIVAVHDVVAGGDGRSPSLIMEYVQGTNLDAFLKGGKPLPLDFCFAVVSQIADALEHAHTMGVIHGDIKPSNILISDDEQVKLVDFGISKLFGSEARPTDRLFGTPRYVAPEQLAGKEADPRSDVFSLGVVLYEMLTGRSPFAGETVTEVTQEIVSGVANFSPEALVDVPEVLHAVLRKALARDPGNRYQSASELMQAILEPEDTKGPTDTAATQDLSQLVFPDLPDVDAVLESVPGEERSMPPSPAPAPADPQPGSLFQGGKDVVPIQRLAQVGTITLVATLLLSLLVLWWVTPADTYNARFSKEHLVRAKVLPLLKEGQRLLRSGEPDVAMRLFARAAELAPQIPRISRLSDRAAQEARDLEAYRQAASEVLELVTGSRAALSAGNPQRALQLATQALVIEPENPEAQALAAAARSRRVSGARTASSPNTSEANPSPPARVPAEGDKASTVRARSEPEATVQPAPPRPRPEPRSTSTISDLRIDVFSYLPKGVLTVYADQQQILLEPFRFVQKSGFLRRKKTAGRLEKGLQLPAGETQFRIFVSADGQDTQSVTLEGELLGGETHVLRLIIAEDGATSAQLH